MKHAKYVLIGTDFSNVVAVSPPSLTSVFWNNQIGQATNALMAWNVEKILLVVYLCFCGMALLYSQINIHTHTSTGMLDSGV